MLELQLQVLTIWSQYQTHLKDYDLNTVSEITSVPKELIERLAQDIATIKPCAIHQGEGINHWFHATEANRANRLWQAAEMASATVGNERATEIAREAFCYGPPPRGAAWGHERLGRYLWTSGHLEESAVEFETAAALLPEGDGPQAAPVFAGLAQAELMLGRYAEGYHIAATVQPWKRLQIRGEYRYYSRDTIFAQAPTVRAPLTWLLPNGVRVDNQSARYLVAFPA